MTETILIPIPLTEKAAADLSDPARRASIGLLVSAMLCPPTQEEDPLAWLIADAKRAARADNLTDSEIDAELAAYNAEKRT